MKTKMNCINLDLQLHWNVVESRKQKRSTGGSGSSSDSKHAVHARTHTVYSSSWYTAYSQLLANEQNIKLYMLFTTPEIGRFRPRSARLRHDVSVPSKAQKR